jgi:O-antigen/teichoic acid export membrane protein
MSTSNRSTLTQRVVRAGAWSLASYVVSFALRFGSNLFMTRQLVPEMFGVMAIAMMVLVGLALFSDVGLKPSIIQSKRGHEPSFLNTAWVVQILRGVVLWCFALLICVLVLLAAHLELFPKDSVYEHPSLPYVLAALSLTTVIAGFESTKLIEASRNLLLGSVTRIEIAAQLVGLIAMIAWVLIDRSIWALVAGSIASAMARTILSHSWLSGTPNHWRFDREAFYEIMNFGKWIFFSSVLYFLVSNGDRMTLGWYADAGTLGAYAIAFLIFSSIDQVLAKIIVDISFPALSEVARERPAKLTEVYYRFHGFLAAAAYFCCGLMAVSGQAIINVLYDRRYEQAGWMLQILALALAIIPLRLATQCFLVLGLARVYFHLNTIRMLALFVALPLGFHWAGVHGALWGIVFSYFSSAPLIIYYSSLHGLFKPRRELIALSGLLVGILSGEALNAVIAFTVRFVSIS